MDRRPADRRLYGSQWRKRRELFLGLHPLCQYCALNGRDELSVLIDHLYPHNGNVALFWDETYWVASCTDCHSGWKQALERRGIAALDALAASLGLPALHGVGGRKL